GVENCIFGGLWQPLGSLIQPAELQAKVMADFLCGALASPDRDIMRREMMASQEVMDRRFVKSTRHGGGPLVVENREGVFSRYPKKESGSWGESDRGGIRLWGKVYNVSAKWKGFLDLIG